MRRQETEWYPSRSIVFEINAQNTELVYLGHGKMQRPFDPLCSRGNISLKTCVNM